MTLCEKDLDTLIDFGAAIELTDENKDQYDFWYYVVARVYKSDGSLYAKVLVVPEYADSDLRGRWFIVRGTLVHSY